MQKINNIVDMLLASVNGIQSLNPTQPMLNPEPGGIDFAQILSGLIGTGNTDENSILTSLSNSEISQVNNLLGQTDPSGAQLITFEIPNSGSGDAVKNNILMSLGDSEIDRMNNLLPQTDTSENAAKPNNNIVNNFIKAVPGNITAGTDTENLILNPGQTDEVNIGRLIDSPFVYDRGSNLSDQGGRSEFSEMLCSTDLEQLDEGESLTIKLPYNDSPITESTKTNGPDTDSFKTNPVAFDRQTKTAIQNIEEITFTKLADKQTDPVVNASRFEVTFKSGENSSNVQAVLLTDKTDPQVQSNLLNENSNFKVKDLQGLIVEHQGKDAKLVLSVPTDKITVTQAAVQTVPADSTVNQPVFDQFMTEDSSARLRQFNLQQRVLSTQVDASSNIENGVKAETEAAVGSKQESGLNHNFAESKQDFGSTIHHKADAPVLNNQNFEGFAEKLSSTLNMDIQSLSNKTEEIEVSDKTRLQMLTRDVQFKIDQPLNRAELPEGGSFRIKMAPESLGKIDVKLDVVQDRMVARMSVDSPLAKQVVESNLHTLRDALQQSGIKVDNISVNVSGQGNNADLSNRQTGQQAGGSYNNGNYDFEADEIEVIPEISTARNNPNLQGSLSIFA